MTTIQVDILDPKAGKLLRDLADMHLISIHDASHDGFLKLLKKLRLKARNSSLTEKEISKEVKIVRTRRCGK